MKIVTFDSLPNDVRGQILTSLCERSEEGIFILDNEFRFKWVNASYENVLGYSLDELQGKTIGTFPLKVLPLESNTTCPKIAVNQINQDLLDDNFFQQEVRYTTSFNTQFTTNLTIWAVRYYDKCYYIGLLRDITAAKDTNEAHQRAIHYNSITALPNRHYFTAQFNTLLRNDTSALSIVVLSIDKFRMISNSLDEIDKNALLKQLISRIKALSLDHLVMFTHFGTHDFALLFDTSDKDIVNTELQKLTDICQQPFNVTGHKFYLHLSMGVSTFPDQGQHLDTLSGSAEIALNAVKHGVGNAVDNNVRWYDDQMNQKTLFQIKLETQLHDAFEKEQFTPYYQPKIDLKTGRFAGFEALVRWQHPEQGLLNASEFVQTIINNNLTYALFKLMAKSVIKQLHDWLARGYEVNVFLNIDAAEFRHPNFINYLREILDLYPSCQSYLNIEITESSLLINDSIASTVLGQLKELGVTIALDDFGTGYSSLSYLQQYDFDWIKIDKSFITNITTEPKSLAIVKAIVSLAHSMDMQVIAEGIENIEQIDLLNHIGCDYGQGYFTGKPLSCLQATQLLAGCCSAVNYC